MKKPHKIATSCMIYHADNWITSALAGRPQIELVTYSLDIHLFLRYKFQREKYSFDKSNQSERYARHYGKSTCYGYRHTRKLMRGKKSGSTHARTHTHKYQMQIRGQQTDGTIWSV